jgi:hypothetical protein
MLLGSHPNIVGVGELTHAFDAWLNDESCSCLQRFRECPFWIAVMERFRAMLPERSLDDASRITRSVENAFDPRRLLFGSQPTDHQQYGEIWRALMNAIGAASGAAVVVDSSKSTRLAAGRAAALSELCRLEVKVIHLVRDPRAVMWSALRGSNRKLELNRPAHIRGGVGRVLLGWCGTNIGVHRTTRTKEIPVMRVRYEDLVTDPVRQLKRIACALSFNLEALVDLMESNCPLEPSHGVLGNRLRRDGPQRLRLDEEWKSRLPSYARALAWLSWPLARSYGYRLDLGS